MRGRDCKVPPVPAADVSVVVAAYNEADHIAGLLDSLRRQTLLPREVIVADDGSRDDTSAIAEHRGARVLRLPHRGPAVARNRGARAAVGDVLVFLDGDMACAPRFLERLVAPIAAGHAVGTFTREMYLGNPERRWARAYAAVRWCPPDRLLPADFPQRWVNFRAVRRDRFLDVGGYDDVGYGEDTTLAPKLADLALAAPGAVCFHNLPCTIGEVFENGRWVGRGAAIRTLRRPWRAHNPVRVTVFALRQIRAGRTPWVLPARLVYHAGVWLGLAESTFAPQRHWK
jgi:glycosyltransferase involved in cell wall biosynthesis